MVNNNNSGNIFAENANSLDENLQPMQKVSNFAANNDSPRNSYMTQEELKVRREGDRLYVNPLTDNGFKSIFSKKDIMREFINDLLQPKSRVKEITFLDKEAKSENTEERGVVYDMRCTSEDGSEFIVEMQNRSQTFFADRILYYLSRSISQQRTKNKDEQKDSASFELKPVYGIFMLNFTLKNLKKQMIRTVKFIVEETGEVFDEKMQAYTIELTGIKNFSEDECKTKIECWIYNLFHMSTTTTPMAFQDRMPVFRKVASAAEISNMTHEEYVRYIDQLDMHDTHIAMFDSEHQLGFEEGMEKGMQQGATEERIKNARAMKAKGIQESLIAEITGLSISEIEKL